MSNEMSQRIYILLIFNVKKYKATSTYYWKDHTQPSFHSCSVSLLSVTCAIHRCRFYRSLYIVCLYVLCLWRLYWL